LNLMKQNWIGNFDQNLGRISARMDYQNSSPW